MHLTSLIELTNTLQTCDYSCSFYCRDIFERVICLNLSTKKMKFFFKRYLEFEQKYGNDDKIAVVKQKAVDYVEAKISQT